MSVLLGHAGGHWSTTLIYLAPFVVVFAVLGWQKLKGGHLASLDEETESSAEREDMEP